MPDADKFMSDGAGNGFPFCPEKVNVSGYDYWTSLGGWSKASTPADDAAKAQSIADSLANAMKLFWNYNGHTVDFVRLSTTTLTIDIEQGEFENGSESAPFEPKKRVCVTSGWSFDQNEGSDETLDARITPIRMYDGTTDDENNFVGYGMFAFADILDPVFLATDQFEDFNFLSYVDEPSDPSNETYEYSDAIDGMWFVAGALGGDVPPTINGLSAVFTFTGFGTITYTYEDFDFYTYPA